ncbi:MAG: hypothetical protein HKL83_04595 [Acidimicrobiaceae bacterium]|nr:hypothetical protein [Acidimicrobiaceae bacterium]
MSKYFSASKTLGDSGPSLRAFSRLKGKLAVFPYEIGSILASSIPIGFRPKVASVIGPIAYLSSKQKRDYALRAQQLASFGREDQRVLTRRTVAVFTSYVLYWLESLAMPRSERAELLQNLSYEGCDELVEYLQNGRGAILATCHLGNWDWGGSWFAAYHHPLAAVVENLKPDSVAEWFYSYRRELGIDPIPLDGPVAAKVIQAVKDGKLVALLSDRDLSGSGVVVNFFNERVRMPSGASVLSLRTKTPIFPAAVYQTPRGGHHVVFLDPIFPADSVGSSIAEKVGYMTQLVTSALETLIAENPTQWHVLQPLPIEEG